MKAVLNMLLGLAVLALVLVVLAYFLPRSYRLERSVVVQAPPESVYALVSDLRAWRRWDPAFDREPGIEVRYSEAPDPASVGGWSTWASASQGLGRATVVALRPPGHVRYRLETGSSGGLRNGEFTLTPVPGGVAVARSDAGDLGHNPVARWQGLFLDRRIGADLEAGLAKLKRVAEEEW